MLWIEIVYIIAVSFAFMMLTAFITGWLVPIGALGPEAKAKLIAIAWRMSEAVIALAALWVLWGPILHGGASGGVSFVLAALFTLLFGAVYVAGSLFAAVTSLGASQVLYFRNRLEKLQALK